MKNIIDLRKLTELNPEHGDEFRMFLKTYQNDMSQIWKFMKLFDDWLYEHKFELKSMYEEEPRTEDDEFVHWTRQKFYYFVFNHYKIDIENEINELLK